MAESEEMQTRIIPENVMQKKRIMGFRKRNIIEGICWALFFAYIISKIPFVSKVQIIIIICVGSAALIVNCLGIRGQALSQMFINFLQYRKFVKKYSYRRLNYASKDFNPVVDENGKIRTTSGSKPIHNIRTLFGK